MASQASSERSAVAGAARRKRRLVGCEKPRLATEPLRKLTRRTSLGYEVADFAAHVLGEPLLPWQRWLAIHALELSVDGGFRFRTVLALAGRQNGKTSLLRTIILWALYVNGARLVLGTAQDLSLARETWQNCIDTISGVPDLAAEMEKPRRVNGDEQFRLTSGARYKIAAANRSAGRGLPVDLLNFDELREQRSWAAWSALSKTTMARPRAQTWAISNAGDDESVVLNHLREAALSGRDASIGLFEWSAEYDCDLDDVKAWAQANPGLGHTISEQAIRSALGTDPPAVFRTEVLCQRVDALDSAVDLAAWRAGADPAGSLDKHRDRVVLCVDVAPDSAHVTMTAAAALADGRVRVEVVQAWKSTDAARVELPGLLQRVKPAAVAWFPSGPAAALAPFLRPAEMVNDQGKTTKVTRPGDPLYVELKGTSVAEACQSFADLVAARRVVHPGDPLLDAHIAGASKLRVGDGWRFTRRGAAHVDGAYSAAGAVYTVLTMPAPQRMPKPMVV